MQCSVWEQLRPGSRKGLARLGPAGKQPGGQAMPLRTLPGMQWMDGQHRAVQARGQDLKAHTLHIGPAQSNCVVQVRFILPGCCSCHCCLACRQPYRHSYGAGLPQQAHAAGEMVIIKRLVMSLARWLAAAVPHGLLTTPGKTMQGAHEQRLQILHPDAHEQRLQVLLHKHTFRGGCFCSLSHLECHLCCQRLLPGTDQS